MSNINKAVKVVDLYLVLGDDKPIRIHVLDRNGNPVNITGFTFKLVVRAQVTDADPALLEMTGTADGGVFDPVKELNQQRLVFPVTDTQTAALAPERTLYHSVKRIDDTVETTIMAGKFVVVRTTQLA